MQWYRGGLVIKAHSLCVSLNSRRAAEEMMQIEESISGLLKKEEKLVEEGSWLKRSYVKYHPTLFLQTFPAMNILCKFNFSHFF